MADIAQHWINGEWVDSDMVAESINPATGEVLGQWYNGGEAEAIAAVAAAKQAFTTSSWSRDRSLRYKALTEMADLFDAHADELGRLVTEENGKILAQGMFESSTAGETLRYNASFALTEAGTSAEVAPGLWFSQYAEPAGVVGIMVPWNGPVALFIRSLGPALAAGDTVAVKMPGQTALGGESSLPDHCRGRVPPDRGRQHLHRIWKHRGALSGGITRCPGHQLHRQRPRGSNCRGGGCAHAQADESRTRR
jgi:betaine-aldehyde dehydrogenase